MPNFGVVILVVLTVEVEQSNPEGDVVDALRCDFEMLEGEQLLEQFFLGGGF